MELAAVQPNAGKRRYRLRPDLEIIPGSLEADGSRSYMIHDPLTSTFDRIEWPEHEIVRRLGRHIDFERLYAWLTFGSAVRVSREELDHFLRELDARGFLESGKFRNVRSLLDECEARRVSPLRWLFGHYLYFRVPLLRPDRFLEQTLWLPKILAWRPLKALFWCLVALALFLLSTRVELFFSSVVLFLSWKNAVWLSLSTVLVKIAHEFSHAYAGKLRGARIAGMGVVFMVMFPLPYCDITDSWRLPRRSRLAISFAGVRTELVIAVLAFIGWACSPPGVARDIFLIMCSGSIASTLFTNLNPGMRFDGYYLLSDLLRVDNLQQRAFAYFRRFYRRALLGLPLREAETRISRGQKALMIVYTMYAWMYRMGLYFGIAVAVYYYFPKIIGIFLFAVEFLVFLARPVINEFKDIWRMRKYLTFNVRLVATGAIFLGLIGWLALPLPRRVGLPAVVASRQTAFLFVPWSGELMENRVQKGLAVRKGEPLFSLRTRAVELERRRVDFELEEVREWLRLAAGDEQFRQNLNKTLNDEKRLVASRKALSSRLAGNEYVAPFDGVVVDGDDNLRPGLYVSKGRFVGQIVGREAGVKAVAYVTERHLEDISEDDEVWFVPDSTPENRIPCRVETVSLVNSLRLDEPALAQAHGGSIPTSVSQGGMSLRPVETIYRIEAALGKGADGQRLGQLGSLYIRTRPRSLAMDAARRLLGIVIRESGF